MLQRREEEKSGLEDRERLSRGRDVLQTEEIANTKVLLMFIFAFISNILGCGPKTILL